MSNYDTINLSAILKCEKCGEDYTHYCIRYHKRLCDNCYAEFHEWELGDACVTHNISGKDETDISKDDYLVALFQEYTRLAEEQERNGIVPCFNIRKEKEKEKENYILTIPERLTQDGQELENIPAQDSTACEGVCEVKNEDNRCPCNADWACLDCLRFLCNDCSKKIHEGKFSTHCILPTREYFIFKKTIEHIAQNIGYEFTDESKNVQLPL